MTVQPGGNGPVTTRAAAETITAAAKRRDRPERTAPSPVRVPLAVGEYYPPAGRRTLGVVIVRRCPGCRHLHLHRVGSAVSADGAIRTGSCGATYKITARIPAPRVGDAA